MNAQQLSHSIYKLLEQTDLQIIEMLKGADAATLNELLDDVPPMVQSAVQHCIDELPIETETTLTQTDYYDHITEGDEIEIETTYTEFEWDYENDELVWAKNGTMKFIGIDESDFDPSDWELIETEYTLED